MQLFVFFGEPNAVILSGSIVKNKDGDEFITTEQAVITASGSVDVVVKATKTGEVNVDAGEIEEIVSAIPKVDTCTNVTAGELGTVLENDAEFRLRGQRLIGFYGIGSLKAIKAKLYSVTGVTSVFVTDNPSDETSTIDGKALLPHSLYCVVNGGSNKDIALAIKEVQTVGCQYNGDIVERVEIDGVKYEVRFDRPETIPIYI